VQGRETLVALQSRLAAAHAAAGAGDREAALAQLRAALDIDPHFLAAQSLRDRLLADAPLAPIPAPSARIGMESAIASAGVTAVPTPTVMRAPAPGVSPEGYARFQARAKQKRLDTRLQAARDAIRRRRFDEASAALDEVSELDPGAPQLALLAREVDAMRGVSQPRAKHRGSWLVAAGAFAATVFAASYLQDASLLTSRPVNASGMLVPAISPQTAIAAPKAVPTTGEWLEDIDGLALDDAVTAIPPAAQQPTPTNPPMNPPVVRAQLPDSMRPPVQQAPDTVGAVAPAVLPPAPQAVVLAAPPPSAPQSVVAAAPPAAPQPVVSAAPPPAPASTMPPQAGPSVQAAPASRATDLPAAPAAEKVARRTDASDDSAQVQQVLQRYRSAYQELDARSAQAVWPAVNEALLARAFDALESQTLTFDACDVHITGAAASATCRGSSRYVPKIGNREPRVEPSTWSFTLRKTGTEWTIETARAER